MKSVREVCELLGITRRTLQEYDYIGLVKHSAENKSGYWLYDDATINKIAVIQIWVECGYTRKEIKRILDMSYDESERELDEVLDKLEKKKKKIEKMTYFIKYMKLIGVETQKISPRLIKRIEYMNLSYIYEQKE